MFLIVERSPPSKRNQSPTKSTPILTSTERIRTYSAAAAAQPTQSPYQHYSSGSPPVIRSTAQQQRRRKPHQTQAAPFTRTQQRIDKGIFIDAPAVRNTFRPPVVDYDYYDEGDVKVIGKSKTKVRLKFLYIVKTFNQMRIYGTYR